MLTRREFCVRGSLGLGALALGCSDIAHPTFTPTLTPTDSPNPTPAPTPEPTATPESSPTAADLRRQVAGLLVVGFPGKSVAADDPVMRAIRDGLGGVILFARNVESPSQLADLTGTLHEAARPRRLIVCVDQEGGAVARLTPDKGFAAVPSAAAVGKRNAANALSVGRTIGELLADAGINLNLAPVVDLNVNPDNPSIGALGRSYSADPDLVVELASATIGGQHEHGVATTLKHFPGLGSATGDTDREFVDITDTWAPVELAPFRELIASGRADVVMSANAVNGQIDRRYPASLSIATLELLRTDLGWTGPTITDDLGAGAIRDSYSNDETLRRALNAGNDLLLLANTGPDRPDIAAESVASIVGQVEAGRIDPARVAQAATRIGSLLARLSG